MSGNPFFPVMPTLYKATWRYDIAGPICSYIRDSYEPAYEVDMRSEVDVFMRNRQAFVDVSHKTPPSDEIIRNARAYLVGILTLRESVPDIPIPGDISWIDVSKTPGLLTFPRVVEKSWESEIINAAVALAFMLLRVADTMPKGLSGTYEVSSAKSVYQEAANLLAYAFEKATGMINKPACVDMSPTALNAFKSIAVAKVQACNLAANEGDRVKSAAAANECYKRAINCFKSIPGWEDHLKLLDHCVAEQVFFEAHLALEVALRHAKAGEMPLRDAHIRPDRESHAALAMAWLKHVEALCASKIAAAAPERFEDVKKRATEARSTVISVGPAPDLMSMTLPAATEAEMDAKPTQFLEVAAASRLEPLEVYRRVKQVEARLKEMSQGTGKEIDALEAQLKATLAELQLPEFLLKPHGSVILPPALLARIEDISKQLGIAALLKRTDACRNDRAYLVSALNDARKMAEDDAQAEIEAAQKYVGWIPTPVHVQNTRAFIELKGILSLLDQAERSDSELSAVLEGKVALLQRLAESPEELTKKIPPPCKAHTDAPSAAHEHDRAAVETLEEIAALRRLVVDLRVDGQTLASIPDRKYLTNALRKANPSDWDGIISTHALDKSPLVSGYRRKVAEFEARVKNLAKLKAKFEKTVAESAAIQAQQRYFQELEALVADYHACQQRVLEAEWFYHDVGTNATNIAAEVRRACAHNSSSRHQQKSRRA